jgi:hypothetical protein
MSLDLTPEENKEFQLRITSKALYSQGKILIKDMNQIHQNLQFDYRLYSLQNILKKMTILLLLLLKKDRLLQ